MAIRALIALAIAITMLSATSHAQLNGEAIWDPAWDPVGRAKAEIGLARDLQGCPTLPACLAVLDTFDPPRSGGPVGLTGAEKTIADNLRRFGDSAKQELLQRAAGAHPARRGLASAMLGYSGVWSWSPSDVPAIRAALRLERGGWMARPLAQIKTPEAIEALVEDLAVAGATNQTGWALRKIGAAVLPYLLPLLADEKSAFSAAAVVGQIGKDALVIAPDWTAIAASADTPKDRRLAALRGLAAMGDGARQHGKDLRALLAGPDPDIRAGAFKTLLSLRDPSVVATVAENCHPVEAVLSRYPQSRDCLWDVAVFGEEARSAGSHLMKFLASRNGDELASAISTLGYIGYDAAIPQIEQQLRAQDWRVAYSAARSVGWLGATGSVPALERVAAEHWLPEIRELASTVVKALKGSERRVARPRWGDFFFSVRGETFIGGILKPVPKCVSGRWKWRDVQFSRPSYEAWRMSLPLGAGNLIGSNKGEFGGALNWQPDHGEVQLLHKHNVVAIEPAEGGAIVLFGLAHMGLSDGYALHVSQRADGGWALTEVARMPSRADALATIGTNLYAAWSANRVVVFSDKEILGLARCVEQ